MQPVLIFQVTLADMSECVRVRDRTDEGVDDSNVSSGLVEKAKYLE